MQLGPSTCVFRRGNLAYARVDDLMLCVWFVSTQVPTTYVASLYSVALMRAA